MVVPKAREPIGGIGCAPWPEGLGRRPCAAIIVKGNRRETDLDFSLMLSSLPEAHLERDSQGARPE